MTATAQLPTLLPEEERPWNWLERLRWLFCGALAVLAHAAIAASLIDWQEPPEVSEVGIDAIIVEYQPEQIQTDPTPAVEKVEQREEPLPVQESEAMLPPKPEVLPAPPVEEVIPVPLQPTRARIDTATWKSEILTLLEHHKRYPSEARARGQQGVARVAFRVDHDGHLLSSRLVGSSGSAVLDAESLALFERAQPFPPPPTELTNKDLTIPLRYNIR